MSSDRVYKTNDCEQSKEYWIRTLPENIHIISLLSNTKIDHVKKSVSFKLPEMLNKNLLRIAKTENAIFTIIVSTISIIFFKRLKCADFTVFIPALEGDPLNNILPLLIHVDTNISFQEFVLGVSRLMSEAYKHMGYPIESVLEGKYKKTLLDEILISFGRIHNKPEKRTKQLIFHFILIDSNLRCCIDYDNEQKSERFINSFWNEMEHCLGVFLGNPKIKLSEVDRHHEDFYSEESYIGIQSYKYADQEKILLNKISELIELNGGVVNENIYDLINEDILNYIDNSIDLALVISKICEISGVDFKLEKLFANQADEFESKIYNENSTHY